MKILIVDDSKAMRMIVRRTLRQAGFDNAETAQASNGVEGLEAVRNSKPDLIISDWNMPEMDGLSFLKAVKQEAADIPFGFITTEGTPEMITRAEEEGAMFFVTKPFTADTIKEKLAGVVS